MAKKKKMSEKKEIKNREDMYALIKRIDKDDPKPEDLKLLSKEMDAKPEVFLSIGNLQKNVFSQVLEKAVSSNFHKECVKRYVEEMQTELGYHSSTFVEKMLIDEIILRWLRLQNMETSYQNNVVNNSHSAENGAYFEKILEQSNKRFLRAVESLVKVRKMIAQTQAKGAEMFKSLLKQDT